MCYAHPGPRCSHHAREKLASATTALHADPNNVLLMKNLKDAQEEYDTTHEGMKALRATGKPSDAMKADIAQQKREAQVNAYNIAKQTGGDGETPTETEITPVPEIEQESPEVQQLRADAESDDWGLHSFVATHPLTPPDVLTRLAEDRYLAPLVASNEAAPAELLTRLANSTDKSTRLQVAYNPNTPPEVLARLAETRVPSLREAVAQHPNASPETLAYLGKSKDYKVFSNVAENPNTPSDALAHIANRRDTIAWAKNNVANHPNTPIETLITLKADEDKQVSEQAHRNILSRSKPELVEALKADFPDEPLDDMPREWLIDLLPTV